jgi:hypothetical protein
MVSAMPGKDKLPGVAVTIGDPSESSSKGVVKASGSRIIGKA